MARYVDNKKFYELIKEYQECSDNVDPWPNTFRIKKDKDWHPDFVARKKEQLNERIERLNNETEEERKERTARLRKCKDELGRIFMSITKHILTQPNYAKYSYDRKQDMQSDALYRMLLYLDRFDLKQTNPFSYFTEFANRAYWAFINESKKNDLKFVSISYIENVDGAE